MNAIWQRLVGCVGESKAPRWITSDVAICAIGRRGSWQQLHDAGVGSALDLRTPDERSAGEESVPPGLLVRRFPIGDHSAPSLPDLVEVSDWVVAQISGGSRVVIGCREGRSRSALVACAALMRLGYPPSVAYGLVRHGQPRIALSDSQITVLEELNHSSGAC